VKQRVVSEKSVVNRIMARLRKVAGIVVRKRHGTAMGVAGDPDLYGSYYGKHFEIEVKRPNDSRSQLTKLQAERLREWSAEGSAITGVARSPEEALAILGLIRPEPVWVCAGCRHYRWQSDEPPARCPNCGHIHFEREVECPDGVL
jgi:hypothetical protein